MRRRNTALLKKEWDMQMAERRQAPVNKMTLSALLAAGKITLEQAVNAESGAPDRATQGLVERRSA